jgi:hypothetical protein
MNGPVVKATCCYKKGREIRVEGLCVYFVQRAGRTHGPLCGPAMTARHFTSCCPSGGTAARSSARMVYTGLVARGSEL